MYSSNPITRRNESSCRRGKISTAVVIITVAIVTLPVGAVLAVAVAVTAASSGNRGSNFRSS